tara:strand:- start:1188 stop:2141 length:954 start_codon:yes stop_codon:yes gene_type:complete
MKFSPARQGIDSSNQSKMDIHGLFQKSMEISNLINPPIPEVGEVTNEERGEKLRQKISADLRWTRKPKGSILERNPKIQSISFNNTMTPQERILTSLFKRKRDVSDKKTIINSNIPIVYTASANRMAHQLATKEIYMKYIDYMSKAQSDPDVAQSINRSMYYMERMGNEFLGVLKKGYATKAIVDEETGFRGSYDHMEEMAKLTDRWVDIFDSMSEQEQIMATIYWFHGIKELDTAGNEVIRSYRMDFPPTKLIHGKTLGLFLDKWDSQVRKLEKDFVEPSGAKILKQYESLPSLNKGFNFANHTTTVDEVISRMCD